MHIELDGRCLLEISAEIAPGQVLTVMGPSGSGKSTLLAFIAGFLSPVFQARGDVRIAGSSILDLPAEQRSVGLLFQDPLLFPHLSVAGNLRFAMPADTKDKAAKIEASLAGFGMAGYGDRDPASLSGGQRSRIALLRTLLAQPHAVLLDEPFSKLDVRLRREIRQDLFARLAEAQVPAIVVSHDPEDAKAAGGQVIELSPPEL